jgi:hypothetical protein
MRQIHPVPVTNSSKCTLAPLSHMLRFSFTRKHIKVSGLPETLAPALHLSALSSTQVQSLVSAFECLLIITIAIHHLILLLDYQPFKVQSVLSRELLLAQLADQLTTHVLL